MSLSFKEFRAKQTKLIAEQSKERKEEEKRRQEQNEEDYWEWYNDNLDRTPWDYADLNEWEDKDE